MVVMVCAVPTNNPAAYLLLEVNITSFREKSLIHWSSYSWLGKYLKILKLNVTCGVVRISGR